MALAGDIRDPLGTCSSFFFQIFKENKICISCESARQMHALLSPTFSKKSRGTLFSAFRGAGLLQYFSLKETFPITRRANTNVGTEASLISRKRKMTIFLFCS